MERKWWHDKIACQLYPKSYQDSDGDGIGDLKGIISRLDYLKELGIDMVWLSPIYASPFVDQGYDISDYYKIAPEFGTMEDFEELVAGLKVVIISISVKERMEKRRLTIVPISAAACGSRCLAGRIFIITILLPRSSRILTGIIRQ